MCSSCINFQVLENWHRIFSFQLWRFSKPTLGKACTFLQELTRREVEYIALSRDTTESDLKQRREIKGGTSFYIDQVCLFLN